MMYMLSFYYQMRKTHKMGLKKKITGSVTQPTLTEFANLLQLRKS